MATEHIISTSLNRHGKRFVQCFAFSKINIPYPRGESTMSETLAQTD